jgi:hypothetical protein
MSRSTTDNLRISLVHSRANLRDQTRLDVSEIVNFRIAQFVPGLSKASLVLLYPCLALPNRPLCPIASVHLLISSRALRPRASPSSLLYNTTKLQHSFPTRLTLSPECSLSPPPQTRTQTLSELGKPASSPTNPSEEDKRWSLTPAPSAPSLYSILFPCGNITSNPPLFLAQEPARRSPASGLCPCGRGECHVRASDPELRRHVRGARVSRIKLRLHFPTAPPPPVLPMVSPGLPSVASIAAAPPSSGRRLAAGGSVEDRRIPI